MKTKPPTTDHAAKIQQILTWMLEGNSEHLIRDAIAATWPKADATPLILTALETLNATAQQSRSSIADWCLEATKFLYQKQVEIGEYAGAMRAVRQMLDLAQPRQTQRPNRNLDQESAIESVPAGSVIVLDSRRNGVLARLAQEPQSDEGRKAGSPIPAQRRSTKPKPKRKS